MSDFHVFEPSTPMVLVDRYLPDVQKPKAYIIWSFGSFKGLPGGEIQRGGHPRLHCQQPGK